MSKRRTKVDDIRNPENYFQKYMAYERPKDNEEDQKYTDKEDLTNSIKNNWPGGGVYNTKREGRI